MVATVTRRVRDFVSRTVWLALGSCALVFFALVIVVRAESHGRVESLAPSGSVPQALGAGLHVGRGYRLVDTLIGMPTVAVVERTTSEHDALAVGRLDGERRSIATARRDAALRIAWTHDGGSILWTRNGLERVNVERGIAESIVDGRDTPAIIRSMHAEPDGPRVFVTMRSHAQRIGACVIDVETGESTELGTDMTDGVVESADVVWSKNIAFVLVSRRRSGLCQLWELGLSGDGGREVGAGWAPELTVDPTGEVVLFSRERDAPMIERGRWRGWWKWLMRPAWSRTGRHVAGTTNGNALWLCDVAAGRGEKVLETRTAIASTEMRSPVWSSDGRFIAFWLGSEEEGDDGVRMFVVDLVRREIWSAGGSIRALAWCPS